MPRTAKTLLKDFLLLRSAREFQRAGEAGRDEECWASHPLSFVWQHHDLFARAGFASAQRSRAPLVLYVHAPQVWEASRWGVRRPLWGRAVERWGECPQLRSADIVACVSEEVASKVRSMGADPERVIVSPMGVDAEHFSPNAPSQQVRHRFGLNGAFVVGWSGSFRRFHGLDDVLRAFAQLLGQAPEARLLLVGDGLERGAMGDLAKALAIDESVIFTGAVPHRDIPSYLGVMDVTVVAAESTDQFHYSPLKLREYLACARPVAVPRLGEMLRELSNLENAIFYEAGSSSGLGAVLRRLRDDVALRARLGRNGREHVLRNHTWDRHLDRLLQVLGSRHSSQRR